MDFMQTELDGITRGDIIFQTLEEQDNNRLEIKRSAALEFKFVKKIHTALGNSLGRMCSIEPSILISKAGCMRQ